ncbi:unnamed protein product [Adineta steineri]|uniref:Tubby C-terminal domain-containing protein n=1 Tax=Adineta steineri TaxID=433720 RepID=A0A819HDW3_9BILA|nr:unnamed protein product [Adineta steineri]CAF3898838.1 unnamed protein product [Adineta steineri]
MSYNGPRNPWQIGSDSEDENPKNSRPTSITNQKINLKPLPAPVQPKSLDWDVPPTKSRPKKKQSTETELNTSKENESLKASSRISSSSSKSSAKSKKSNELVSPSTTTESSSTLPPPVENSSAYDPIKSMEENLNKFIYTPIPKDYSSFVQCSLRRDKDGVQGSFFPTFYLQAERPGDGRKVFFLLAARKVTKVKRQPEFLITTNVTTLSEKSGGDGYVGKLRGINLSGTEYILYDNGLSPNKISNTAQLNNRESLRRELVGIIYNTNLLGFKGPRQFTTVIPQIEQDIRPSKSEPGILDQWRNRRFGYLMQLRNKVPTYNEETKTYILRFTGNRVAQASVKNFQIIMENDKHEEEIVMQFGRVDEDLFTCDYRYPLSAIQAFGIALSSFDSRIARE